MSENVITDEDGHCPWFAKHNSHFSGKLIPFGARIRFIPNATTDLGKDHLKFAPTSVDGIFLGYELQSGNRWTGHYSVMALTELAKTPLSIYAEPSKCAARSQTVAEIVEVPADPIAGTDGTGEGAKPPGPDRWWTFPCRKRYESENGTLEGLAKAERLRIESNLCGHESDVRDAVDEQPRSGTELSVRPTGTPVTSRGVPNRERQEEGVPVPEQPPVPAGPSFAPSGHSIYKFKGTYSVTPRPPHISSPTWAAFGPPGELRS